MSPSRDQRALLELILRRGHGYADIATLLEISPAEVRARAHEALAALGPIDPDADAALADLLLGQLDPDERERTVRALERDRETLNRAEELAAKLRLLVPEAELPDLPSGGRPARSRLRGDPRIRIAGAALAVTLSAVVLAVILGGGEDEAAEAGPTTTAAETTQAAAEPVIIDLAPSPAASPDASGRVGIGETAGTFALQYFATGLEPTRGTERYVVWLFNGRDAAVPLTVGRRVGPNGRLNGLASLPPDVVRVLPETRFVDISLEPRPQERGSPAYRGESILRGRLGGAGTARG